MSIDVRILETAIIFAEDRIIFSMNLLISYHTNLTNKMVIVERSKFNLECTHKRIFSMYGIWESYNNLHFFRISECTYVVWRGTYTILKLNFEIRTYSMFIIEQKQNLSVHNKKSFVCDYFKFVFISKYIHKHISNGVYSACYSKIQYNF